MDAHSKTWLVWLVGVLGSFAWLERKALKQRIEDKPSGTLTATFRRWLGTEPRGRRRWFLGGLFTSFCLWLAGHMVSTKIGPN